MADQTAALFDKLDGFYLTKSEHDWLERRFANMTEKEKILFQGAMELEKPQEIGHVTRIASQLDCYDLFYPYPGREKRGGQRMAGAGHLLCQGAGQVRGRRDQTAAERGKDPEGS